MRETLTPKKNTPGYDDLLEDIFGLNIRGLKSLWTSIRSPLDYYKASREADWTDRFTPSFRLWFTLLALSFFFQFFWASKDSAIIQNFAAQVEASGTLPSGLSSTIAALTFSRWYYGLLPFCMAAALSVLAIVYRAYGEKLNYIERQRRIFITVVPSTFLNIFLTTAFGFLTRIDLVLPLFIGTLILYMAIDCLTAYRGAFFRAKTRVWRSLTLGVCITVASSIGAMTAQFLTSLIIYVKYVA